MVSRFIRAAALNAAFTAATALLGTTAWAGDFTSSYSAGLSTYSIKGTEPATLSAGAVGAPAACGRGCDVGAWAARGAAAARTSASHRRSSSTPGPRRHTAYASSRRTISATLRNR